MDVVIVYRPCIVCDEYRATGSNGVTINSAGFVCKDCRDEFMAVERNIYRKRDIKGRHDIADEMNEVQNLPA